MLIPGLANERVNCLLPAPALVGRNLWEEGCAALDAQERVCETRVIITEDIC